MGALDGLDVQVANAIVLADRRVARVGQGAGALVAQPGDVVLVPANAMRQDNNKRDIV